jgi:outer membrane protein assembly factor BamA
MKKLMIILFVLIAFSVFAAEEGKKDENFFVVVPVPLYTPETQWAAYLIAEYIFKLDPADKITPSSAAQISLDYTQRNQSDVYLEFSHYWKNSDYYLKIMLEYKKYPDKFFGIGNHDRHLYTGLDRGYDYTLEYEYIWVEFYKKIFGGLHFGARWLGQHNVMLASGYPGLVPGKDITGAAGGNDSGFGILAKWDTRDNVYYSMSGDYLQASVMLFGEAIGSGSHFIKWDLDLRHYFKINDEHSISAQAVLLAEAGSPPFYFMNMIGGEKLLRGYFEGSYRDRCLTALQAEYKWILFSRFVADVNAGFGAVADEITKLSTADILWSAGLGFRFIFDEVSRMTFRIDLGFGRNDSGVYLVAGEAF